MFSKIIKWFYYLLLSCINALIFNRPQNYTRLISYTIVICKNIQYWKSIIKITHLIVISIPLLNTTIISNLKCSIDIFTNRIKTNTICRRKYKVATYHNIFSPNGQIKCVLKVGELYVTRMIIC